MGRQILVNRTLGLREGRSAGFSLACGFSASAHGGAPNWVSILASSARVREASKYCTTQPGTTPEKTFAMGRKFGDRAVWPFLICDLRIVIDPGLCWFPKT